MALIILKQILVMSIYMLIGYLLYKSGKITDEGSRSFAGIMAYIIIPSTVLTGLLVEYTPERMKEFGLSFLMGLLTILIAIIISALFFKRLLFITAVLSIIWCRTNLTLTFGPLLDFHWKEYRTQ